jgi:hypothetical protein
LCFYQGEKKIIDETDISQGNVKKALQECLVIPDPLSPTPSTSSDNRTPENTEKDPDDSEAADERDLQMDYCSDYWYSPNTGAVTNN